MALTWSGAAPRRVAAWLVLATAAFAAGVAGAAETLSATLREQVIYIDKQFFAALWEDGAQGC